MSCNAVVCVSVLLEGTLHVSPEGRTPSFYPCHNGIVHSHQLCSVAMHSLAHFNMSVAFDGESEIQLMFC